MLNSRLYTQITWKYFPVIALEVWKGRLVNAGVGWSKVI